jgi:ABC-type antimicrobial peptide transport system permease subunit
MLYGSLIQNYSPLAALDVRMSGDPEAVLAGARRQVQALDPDLLLQSRTLPGMIRNALWAPRLAAGMLSAFGGLALLLAIVGIYGLISYSVNQRVREIGVRMALGATTANVERMILGEAVRLAGLGIMVGLAAALAASRLVKNMLFGAASIDGTVYLAAPAILAAVALLAGWLPARRATRIQPGQALRHD